MPLLSLLLVVHREQGWLPELAESVLGQGSEDFELVAVDNASPDHAPAMLDELAARDARVRVRHLGERVGLGEARGVALADARGEYAWVVRSTDVVASGALAAVAERLRAERPPLLLVNHLRGDMFGGTRPGPHAALTAGLAAGGGGTLDSHPALADAAAGAFDKVFRVEGLSFGPGAFSELTAVWPLLLAGERVSADPEPRYVRREPPNAVPEGSPFDALAQYEEVLRGAGERAGLVLPAMLRHELALLGSLRGAERDRFLQGMADALRRHDMPALPSRGLALRAGVLERGGPRAYGLFEDALGLRLTLAPGRLRSATRARVKRATRIRSGAVERHYRTALRKPIDPELAVFAAYWYRGYSCNPRAIYERARELVPHVRGVWVVNTEGAHTVPDGVDYVMAGTREYYELVARAKWFVNNVNFPNRLVKREGSVHVMTHHGTPLKHMGLDLRTAPDGGRRSGLPGLLRRCSRWDFSISQNAFTTPIWERVYPTRYESLETGYPRNDALARATPADVSRAREALGIPEGRRVVLYTPTHREYEEAFVPRLDLASLSERLGGDWVVLARAHYFYDGLDLGAGARVIDVSDHPSIEELCIASEALVTDYSSIMFDYAVLDRPIAIHAPDWEEYRTRRGTYFDLMAEPPGAVATTEAELADALLAGDPEPERRAAFRARFAYLEDGHAAERVVRRVWLGEPVTAPPAPTAAIQAVTP